MNVNIRDIQRVNTDALNEIGFFEFLESIDNTSPKSILPASYQAPMETIDQSGIPKEKSHVLQSDSNCPTSSDTK